MFKNRENCWNSGLENGVYVVDGNSDVLEDLNGFDAHGVDDASEADDEVVLALVGEHGFEGVQVVLQLQVRSRVRSPVHVQNRVYFSQLLSEKGISRK